MIFMGDTNMKKFKLLRNLFIALALLLSLWISFMVGFNYSAMLCGIEHKGFSAPANTAFLLAIPYYIGIVVCGVLAFVFNKKAR